MTEPDKRTGKAEPLTPEGALPCGYTFAISGGRCGAKADHPVHVGGWRGREPEHTYQPEERRTGHDRRAARQSDDRLRKAAQAVSDSATVLPGRPPTSPRWVLTDAVFSALRAALASHPEEKA